MGKASRITFPELVEIEYLSHFERQFVKTLHDISRLSRFNQNLLAEDYLHFIPVFWNTVFQKLSGENLLIQEKGWMNHLFENPWQDKTHTGSELKCTLGNQTA